ncbi:MAG: MFS transporter [Promethearchaeota archaeon]
MATREQIADDWKIASTGKMISYAFGYIYINFFLGYGLAPLYYFYQDEIFGPSGLPFATIVILMSLSNLIFLIWNMVNDPLLGFLTDKPRSWSRKWGVRAPWIVICSAPILIFYILLWTPPAVNIKSDYMVIFYYYIIMTCLFDTFFSIFNDQVYGGFTNQFPSEFERRRAFAIATLFMGIILTAMGITLASIIVTGDPQSFVRAAIVLTFILIILNIILLLGIRESDSMKEMLIKGGETRGSFFSVMKTSLGRRNFVISLIGYTISISANLLWAMSVIYRFEKVWGLPYATVILPLITGLVGFIVAIPFWSNYAKKHGFKKTYYRCFILHGIFFLPYLFVGVFSGGSFLPIRGILFPTRLLEICIFEFLIGIMYSGEVIMLMPVASDTCDDVAVTLGKRQDGLLQGIRTFFFRFGYLIVLSIIVPFGFLLSGYDPLAFEQTQTAKTGILIIFILIPALMYIIMGLLFRKIYTLDGAVKAELVRQLKEKGLVRT